MYSELFCSICLIHDSFFKNDKCPRCWNGRCTRYEDLTAEQKIKARKQFNAMLKNNREISLWNLNLI